MLDKKLFHTLSIEETLKEVNSDVGGLSSANAEIRLENNGKNELPKKSKKSKRSWLLPTRNSTLSECTRVR